MRIDKAGGGKGKIGTYRHRINLKRIQIVPLLSIIMKMDYPFVSSNNDFRIQIKTEFDFDQSNPLQFHYLFRYTILITNEGSTPAQLVSRKWFIKDAKGEVRVVEGPGVIGETPYFEPGESFEYSSFCPLSTLTGEMWGHFNMLDNLGESFKIETPNFKFKVPKDLIDDY